VGGLEHRLRRLESETRPEPQEDARERIREQAEHANHCGWGEECGRWLLFEIDDYGVTCTHDGRPVTDPRQILAEAFYWMEVEWGGPGLVHDEEAQMFYTPSGALALSRNRLDLRHLMGKEREERKTA
jgi:hypothetical protein